MTQQFRPPPEPAHISIVRQFDDLVAILKQIRQGQDRIDRAFDEIASQIGFVVATTMPVSMAIGQEGTVERAALKGEHLEGTLFEKILMPVVHELLAQPLRTVREQAVTSATHDFYVIWYEALRLKLGSITLRPIPEPAHFNLGEAARPGFRPPPEPAHSLGGLLVGTLPSGLSGITFRPPPEPAHWFDRNSVISETEQLQIVALDEVYPELKLVDRINSFRQAPSQG